MAAGTVLDFENYQNRYISIVIVFGRMFVCSFGSDASSGFRVLIQNMSKMTILVIFKIQDGRRDRIGFWKSQNLYISIVIGRMFVCSFIQMRISDSKF